MVEAQAHKDNPNKKVIVSNLKIAADVLDTYISDTLKKPSKVVKDWVEALLLQNIDFKVDESITKGAFESITGEQPQTAKLAEKKRAEREASIKAETTYAEGIQSNETAAEEPKISEQPKTENKEIEALIIQAQNMITSAPKEALNVLSAAFGMAQNSADKLSMAKIYSQIADVQNNLNNLHQALDCLHASTVLAYETGNNELKTKNHKHMATIYDEAGYMDNALEHYFASLGIDGELDDTDNQADTLNAIGLMYTARYLKDTAIGYYKDALELAKINKNSDIMSNSFFNTAITFANVGENDKALNNLKNAGILSHKASNSKQLCSIYEEAGDLMAKKSYTKRAQDFYKKSYRMAESIDDKNGLVRLRKKLLSVAA